MSSLHNNLPTGVVLGEPAEVYHAADGVTNHRLAEFAPPNFPIRFFRTYVSKEAPRNDHRSDALDFGEYLHTLALEGETVADSRYALVPGDAPKYPTTAQWSAKKPSEETQAAISWWTEFNNANKGKKQLDRSSFDLAWKMVGSIRANKTAAGLFSRGLPEVVLRMRMKHFTLQSRIDWLDQELDQWRRPTIVDLKTIESLSEFPRQFHKFGYYRQAGFYQLIAYEVLKLEGAFPRFVFVVVEKNEPFQCQVFEADEVATDRGRRDVQRDLERLVKCCESGVWPGAPEGITPIGLPEWMEKTG